MVYRMACHEGRDTVLHMPSGTTPNEGNQTKASAQSSFWMMNLLSATFFRCLPYGDFSYWAAACSS